MRNAFKGLLLILAVSVLSAGVLTAGGTECAKDRAVAKGGCTAQAAQASTEGTSGCAAHAAVADGQGCAAAKCPRSAALQSGGKRCGTAPVTAATVDSRRACPRMSAAAKGCDPAGCGAMKTAMAKGDAKACDPAGCAAMKTAMAKGDAKACDPAACAAMKTAMTEGNAKACDPASCAAMAKAGKCDPATCPRMAAAKAGDKGCDPAKCPRHGQAKSDAAPEGKPSGDKGKS